MQKPISIAIRETKQQIVEVLNNSGLPIDVINYIIKDIGTVVSVQAEAEYQQAMSEYIEAEEDEQNGNK